MHPIATLSLFAAVLVGAAIPLATTGQLFPEKATVTRAEPTEQELWDALAPLSSSVSFAQLSQPGSVDLPGSDLSIELEHMPLVVPPEMSLMPVSIPAPPEVAKILIDEHEPSYSLVEK